MEAQLPWGWERSRTRSSLQILHPPQIHNVSLSIFLGDLASGSTFTHPQIYELSSTSKITIFHLKQISVLFLVSLHSQVITKVTQWIICPGPGMDCLLSCWGQKQNVDLHVYISVDAGNTDSPGDISCLCGRMGDKKGPCRLLSFILNFHSHFLCIRRMLSVAYA